MATSNKIINPAVPNLPLGTEEYERRYQDQFTNVLRLYFNQVDNFSQGINVPQNGTTANRPITFLQVGQFYFDTTLGYPIWYDGNDWVDSSGTVV